jgi:hypothetical protein
MPSPLAGNAFPQTSQSIRRSSRMSSSRTINDLPDLPQLTESRSSFLSSLIRGGCARRLPTQTHRLCGNPARPGGAGRTPANRFDRRRQSRGVRLEEGARADVDSPRLPLASRTDTRGSHVDPVRCINSSSAFARLESLRAVRRDMADGGGFAAVNRLRRLCQGGHLITAAAESHRLDGPALRACPLDVPVGFPKLRRNRNTHIRRTRQCRRGR